MKVRDLMSKDVQVARPGDTLQEVASRMQAGNFGFMPVADGDTLIGTITDRDIVVRAVAGGVAASAPGSAARPKRRARISTARRRAATSRRGAGLRADPRRCRPSSSPTPDAA